MTDLDPVKRLLKPVMRFTYQPLMRLTRGMTLGVRCAVVTRDGEILLIRHSYAPGWTFPGGGVERGESIHEALVRELWEEAGVILDAAPRLHGVYANFREFPGDHVAMFVADRWSMPAAPKPGVEIVEHRFFAHAALPEAATAATRRRVDEIFFNAGLSADW
jgi:8-oxo-dGTP pyrophosphatase MutT (NUDIX family)